MKKLEYILDLLKLFIAKCMSPILKTANKENRDIWLVGERKSEAKDNGYHLFKYIRLNHPDEKVYYVIDKNSKDLDKIKNLGNIIYHDNLKHYIYYIMSSKLICAHLGSCVPDSPVCWKFSENDMKNKKKIFIQHGITKELIPSLMYENTKSDLFVCGAKTEYEFVKSEFGYPEGNVKYLGFARFDNLHDIEVKNQILVIPTWRKWIPGMTWSDRNNEDNKKEFLKCGYYKKYNQFINNEKIHQLLESNNMNLILYPHHEMQGYIDLFRTKSSRVIIAKEDEYDIQTLLKESKMMITDYSSVAFDFGYMRKPVIYYQFDEKEYYKNHYQKGYFDYEDNGFGPIVTSLDELIIQINNYINQNIGVDKYLDRSKKIFPLYDTNNCARHYEEITNI